MAPDQAAKWGEGTVRSGLLAALRVQRKKVYFGMEDQCFLFILVFDGSVGSCLENRAGHTPIPCLYFPIRKL